MSSRRRSYGMRWPAQRLEILIDNGLTPADLGVLTGTIGIVLCLAAIAVAGGAVRRWGARPVLLVLLGAQSVVFVLYLLAALQPISTTLLSGLFLGKSAIFAGTFVALYTVLMGWTSPDQTGVDFTLFQCADALVSVVAGLCGGVIAHHLGYGTCFALAAVAGDARVVVNAAWQTGRTGSIQAGLAACERQGPVAIWPVDTPCVLRADVERLVAATADHAVVIASDGTRGGHPVVVADRARATILAAPITASFRDITRNAIGDITYVTLDSGGCTINVDDTAQLAVARRWFFDVGTQR